jgi:hypothetical protein
MLYGEHFAVAKAATVPFRILAIGDTTIFTSR